MQRGPRRPPFRLQDGTIRPGKARTELDCSPRHHQCQTAARRTRAALVRSRPQHEDLPTSSFLVATSQPYHISNMGDGYQTFAIKQFLKDAKNAGKVAYFPLVSTWFKVPQLFRLAHGLKGRAGHRYVNTNPWPTNRN